MHFSLKLHRPFQVPNNIVVAVAVAIIVIVDFMTLLQA